MRRIPIASPRALLLGACAATLLGVAAVAACGFSSVASGPADGAAQLADSDVGTADAPPPTDADADAADADVLPEAGFYSCPDGTLVSDCSACGDVRDGGAVLSCPTTRSCVTSCPGSCAGRPIACVTCMGSRLKAAQCSPDLSPMPSCAPSTCSCSGNGGITDCPLDQMVCLDVGGGNDCVTCGDSNTGGQVCKDGTGMKKCKDLTESAVEKRYLCK